MIQDDAGMELRMILGAADFRGRAVLEVGCGDGRVTARLAAAAASLVAIDPDEARLAKARAAHPGLDFRSGSGEGLDFPDGSFDIVAYTFSLHHQDAPRALEEAGRVLRRGGMVIAVEPDLGGDMHGLFRLFRQEDDRIAEADGALRRSRMASVSRQTFDIEYLFEDMEDLYDYFFGGYGLPREEARMAEMAALVGARATDRPMRLLERANITALRKA